MPPPDYNLPQLTCPIRYRSCLAEKERLAHERREVIFLSFQNDSATNQLCKQKNKQRQNNSATKLVLGERQAQTWCAPARGASDGTVKEKCEPERKYTKDEKY